MYLRGFFGPKFTTSPVFVPDQESWTGRRRVNLMPPLNPNVADIAPTERALTPYDEEHTITYMRMLDADAEGADWREVARIALHLDPDQDTARARRAFESRLAR
jgi:hypothetical protein